MLFSRAVAAFATLKGRSAPLIFERLPMWSGVKAFLQFLMALRAGFRTYEFGRVAFVSGSDELLRGGVSGIRLFARLRFLVLGARSIAGVCAYCAEGKAKESTRKNENPFSWHDTASCYFENENGVLRREEKR